MIVIDASAAVDLLIRREPVADWLYERVSREREAQVPALFDVEVLHSLRRLELSGSLTDPSMQSALADFAALRATRHDHQHFRSRIWALRSNLTAYDAAYVALAEALDSPLVTTDARLARSSGHTAAIESPPA